LFLFNKYLIFSAKCYNISDFR